MKKQNSKSFARADRIAAKVQMLVAEILREREIPVTLVGAESSRGLQFVRLYWQGAKDLQKRLDSAKDIIRFELAQRMKGDGLFEKVENVNAYLNFFIDLLFKILHLFSYI